MLWLHEHPRHADALLAALVTGLSLVAHFTFDDAEFRRPTWWTVPLILVSTVPLAWRRRWPTAVLGIVVVAESVLQLNSVMGAGFLNVLIAAYNLGAYVAGRRLWVAGGTSFAFVSVLVTAGVLYDDLDLQTLVSTCILYASSIVLGDNMRRRRERAAELVERAERAEREQELVARQRVQQERTRIARELHDVVAHSLTVMIIQAGAARRQVRTNVDQAIGSLEAIEATGRDAMNEMRRVLGVLRNDDDRPSDDRPESDRAPQPSLDALDDLMASVPDLPIVFCTSGDLSSVPPGIELSAYRVVQEALTNVRRHAGRVDRVDVEVAVDREGDRLVITVADDGRGAVAPVNHAGYGLRGMEERVTMFGGHIDAGPRVGGGWRVKVTFPLAPHPVGDPVGEPVGDPVSKTAGKRVGP